MAWNADIAGILEALRPIREPPKRLETACAMCVGRPFRPNPLAGGPGRHERVRVALTSFDCVTFVEAMLALALSSSPTTYRARIIQLRYGGRAPSWESRLHYWSQWLATNERAGLIEIVPPDDEAVARSRTLESVPGVPPISVTVHFHPWSPHVPAADIVAFGSERTDADVFHVGIVTRGRLYHAARSVGKVVEEPFAAFLAREHGPGLLLSRMRARG